MAIDFEQLKETVEDLKALYPDAMLGPIKLLSAGRFIEPGDPWPEGLLGLEVAPGTYVVPEFILREIKALVDKKAQ